MHVRVCSCTHMLRLYSAFFADIFGWAIIVSAVAVSTHLVQPHLRCVLLCAAEMHKRGFEIFFGDLVCKWFPWMDTNAAKTQQLLEDQPEAAGDLPPHLLMTREQLQTMTPATSAVHSHAHVWWCQVLYGPLYQLGVGLENGETTELVNAYFSKLAGSTRNMSIGSKCRPHRFCCTR